MGKGSKMRPLIVDRKKFENNWDRIFNKQNQDFMYESDNPAERPYDMWSHSCEKEGPRPATIYTQKGQACNWCGKYEDGSLD